MNHTVYLPSDEFCETDVPNLDLAADYLELMAVYSKDGIAFCEDIVNSLRFATEADLEDINAGMDRIENVVTGALDRIKLRDYALQLSYPFKVDRFGSVVSFTATNPNLGQSAYLVSLILSNLRAVTPLLGFCEMHPTDEEVRQLRKYFQYFATAAVAAEIRGSAWSFGSPRPDGTGFRTKLSEIWRTLKDGKVGFDPSAPSSPKDDKVDIFAWRPSRDGLPGFLLVAAQVATGRNWKDKSIKDHINGVFQKRWFKRQPVTDMIPYHVIPFARPDEAFRDDVLVLGNVLHRLRVPRRVAQAAQLSGSGTTIEAFDQLDEAVEWVQSYVDKFREK